jgi:2-enoate reductase
VGLKFSAWEEVPNGIDHELALKIAQRMAAEGIAYLHTQTTAFFPPIAARSKYPTMSPMYLPRNTLLELAERIKRKIKNVPVLASGGIVDPREADKIIADGKADMVVLGRALLADHEWPNKAKEGRRIRPCIRCNVCHYEIAGLGKEGVCSVNPHFLHELEEPLGKVKESKKVAVVGAGPGGIIAALTACQRGHEVTLYEKQNRVGGLLILASAPSFKRDLKALLEYYQAEIRDSRVKLKLNTKATPDTIRRVEPDALIIAVGSPPVRPEIPGIDRDNVITAEEALQNPRRVKGKNVVVIGGGVVGCETALHLARKSKNVVIVELLEKLMPLEENRNNIVVLEELLEKAGVKAYTRSKPVEITSEDVWIITDGDKMQKIPADTTVLAIGRKPDSEFIDALKQSCPESYVIGDSVKEGRIFEAVHDADHTARQI